MITPDDEIRLELFQALMNQSPDAIVFVDSANRIRFWTRSAETLFGISPSEIPDNSTVRRILGLEFVTREHVGPNRENSNSVDTDPTAHPSVRAASSNSEDNPAWVKRAAIPIAIGGQPWQMFVLKNASTQDTRHAELERQAITDPLSDLLNRRGFQLSLESNLDRSLTLAIIDVDFFKRINDEFGHERGDDAIKWIAQKLRGAFQESVCLGRLGGDEFGVLLTSQCIDETRSRFESFCDNVEADRSGGPLGMTISIGVAVANQPGVAPRELLFHADKAMYQSKQEGRNRVTVVEIEPGRQSR